MKRCVGVVAFAVAWAMPVAASTACRTADAVAVNTQPPPDDLQTGITLYTQGRYAEAETHLRSASGPEANAYLAASLVKQKKYVDAEAPAKAALEVDPIHEVAVAALGESLVGQKKYEEAIDRLSPVVKQKPEMAYAYFWRGQAYYGKKKLDRMAADYETFLRLAPKAPEAPTVRQILSSLR